MSLPPDGRTEPTVPASARKEFMTALRNWVVIMEFLVREQLKTARGKAGRIGIAVAIAEPFAMIVMFYLVRGLFRGTVQDYGQSLFLFLASGMMPFFFFVRTSTVARRGQANPNRRMPRINSLDTWLANVATQAVIWVPMTAIVFIGMVMYGIDQARPKSIATCIYAMFLMMTLGAGLGLFHASVARFLPAWPTIIGLATRGMVFFSGVIHLPDFMYPSIREWLVWNPLLHGVILFRLGVYGNEYPTLLYDEAYLIKSAIILVFVGLVADRATLRYSSN